MRLDQFKFKKSLEFGIKEIATVNTDSVTKVVIKRNDISMQLVKFVNDIPTYTVVFMNTGQGKEKLNKALKNIGKR